MVNIEMHSMSKPGSGSSQLVPLHSDVTEMNSMQRSSILPNEEGIDYDDEFDDEEAIPELRQDHIYYPMAMFFVGLGVFGFLTLVPFGLALHAIWIFAPRLYSCGIPFLYQFGEKAIIVSMIYVNDIDNPTVASSAPHASSHYSLPKHLIWKICFMLKLITLSTMTLYVYFKYVPSYLNMFIDGFLTDVDGTTVVGYAHLRISSIIFVCQMCSIFYILNLIWLAIAVYYKYKMMKGYHFYITRFFPCSKIRYMRRLLVGLMLLLGCMVALCLLSAWVYLIPHDVSKTSHKGVHCDPLDETECLLPFPNSFYTMEDATTDTGRRVNIESKAMDTLFKSRGRLQFPNQFDGFSTNGNILFNLDGFNGRGVHDEMKLMGSEAIELSVTNRSLTLLVDVSKRTLVHHFAEQDALDKRRPLTVIQPAKPLDNNTTYAVALVNGVDKEGLKIQPTRYLQTLMSANIEDCTHGQNKLSQQECKRAQYFQKEIQTAILEAAPWVKQDSIQMMFEFHTTSKKSQIGQTTEKIINHALTHVRDTGVSREDVRIVRVEKRRCDTENDLIGGILHGEIDVPWYLQSKDDRFTNLIDTETLEEGVPQSAIEKFMVVIPCSLISSGPSIQKEVRAIIDFGHGFIGTRMELAYIDFLRLANKRGYLMFSSDWRGMSAHDTVVISRSLLATPETFTTIRDNILQGFASRVIIQHFSRRGLIDMLQEIGFDLQVSAEGEPQFIFLGISLGAILGSSYTQLIASSGLIDRAIIVSPGHPFSLVMSRSSLFPYYLKLFRLNINTDRQIRVFLPMLQMLWDSLELGSVVEAGSFEDHSIKTLIQAGLGDATVTTISTHYTARAYKAQTVPANPQQLFGVPSASNFETAKTILTELKYMNEVKSLPTTNLGGYGNQVHRCLNYDDNLHEQKVNFIEHGTFTDPCEVDGCIRQYAAC